MTRDYAEKALSGAMRYRSLTVLAGQINRRLVEALVKTVPEGACETLRQRVVMEKKNLMPSSLP